MSADQFRIALLVLFFPLPTVVADDSLELTPETFDSVVDGSKHVFLQFYAPWCGHCKTLATEWEILAHSYGSTSDTVIAQLNADKHKTLASKYEVSGFPTIKFFEKGSTTVKDTYMGERTAERMVEYLNKETSNDARVLRPPEATTALDDDNFQSIALNPSNDVLVMFYAPWCGHSKRLAPDYDRVARAFRTEPGVVVAKYDADTHKRVAAQIGIAGYPTIRFFPRGNKAGVTYEGPRDAASLVDFLNQQLGTRRLADGSLDSDAGLVPHLAHALRAFAAAPGPGPLQEAKDITAQLQLPPPDGTVRREAKNSKYYIQGIFATEARNRYYSQVMERVLDRGAAFVHSEMARLHRVLQAGGVRGDKATEMRERLNILRAFRHHLTPES